MRDERAEPCEDTLGRMAVELPRPVAVRLASAPAVRFGGRAALLER